MEWEIWFYFCHNTSLKLVSIASVDMWNGRDQFGSLKTRSIEIFSFKFSKVFWQRIFQKNALSLLRSLNNGDVKNFKFSINNL